MEHLPDEIMLSIVMPAYNEGDKIFDNLMKVSKIVESFNLKFEIIAVNDGSSDRTKAEIKRAVKENPYVKGISYKKNGGKGKAIQKGVEAARGRFIAFLDADLDLPPEQLKLFIDEIKSGRADAVIGSKLHKDSEVQYPAIRKVFSWGYYILLRLLFRLKVKDTQTGLKMFKAEVIKPIISQIKTTGFAYDIEILALICKKGYYISELPVKVVFSRSKGMERIHISDIINMFWDTIKVFYNIKIKHCYN